jgi:predicted nucleic acid-binding protein
MRTFIDTNVFLYAAGGVHPQRARCVQVLQSIADGKLNATINSEVIQEILYVLSRRGRLDDALTLASHTGVCFSRW